MSLPRLETEIRTDTGRHRPENEDAVLELPERGVYCVADGMGGAEGGRMASHLVLDRVREAFDRALPKNCTLDDSIRQLRAAVDRADADIKAWADRRGVVGTGTTFVGLMFDPTCPWFACILHAGDSRAYRLRRGLLRQLTRDHSVATAMGVNDDRFVPRRLRNVITHAIGIQDGIGLEETSIDVEEGDLYLLCSDGLTRMLDDDALQRLLTERADGPIDELADELVHRANEAGGEDNITIALVRVSGPAATLLADALGPASATRRAAPPAAAPIAKTPGPPAPDPAPAAEPPHAAPPTPEPEPETEAAVESQPEPEPKPQPEPAAEPESPPEDETQAEPASQPEPEPQPKPVAEPEPASEPEPAPQRKPAPVPVAPFPKRRRFPPLTAAAVLAVAAGLGLLLWQIGRPHREPTAPAADDEPPVVPVATGAGQPPPEPGERLEEALLTGAWDILDQELRLGQPAARQAVRPQRNATVFESWLDVWRRVRDTGARDAFDAYRDRLAPLLAALGGTVTNIAVRWPENPAAAASACCSARYHVQRVFHEKLAARLRELDGQAPAVEGEPVQALRTLCVIAHGNPEPAHRLGARILDVAARLRALETWQARRRHLPLEPDQAANVVRESLPAVEAELDDAWAALREGLAGLTADAIRDCCGPDGPSDHKIANLLLIRDRIVGRNGLDRDIRAWRADVNPQQVRFFLERLDRVCNGAGG